MAFSYLLQEYVVVTIVRTAYLKKVLHINIKCGQKGPIEITRQS